MIHLLQIVHYYWSNTDEYGSLRRITEDPVGSGLHPLQKQHLSKSYSDIFGQKSGEL